MTKLLLAVLVAVASWSVQAQQPANTARVAVLASGKTLLNGKPSDRAALDAELKRLQASKGRVEYYSEEVDGEPTQQSMDTLGLIGKYKLPVAFASRPDFADAAELSVQARASKP